MDSPLNRAHQQERKAEQLTISKKYVEAVTCYEIAAGYVTEAMKVTKTSQALISLQLQYQDHLRKQRILKAKLEQQILAEKKQKIPIDQNVTQQSLDDKSNYQNVGLLAEEESNSNLNCSFSSGDEILGQDTSISTQDNIQNISMEDLQMQVLSLTQALEDCNRENNHLRNIIVKFKEILQIKFGFSEEEIEDVLIDKEEICQEPSEISLEKINYDKEIINNEMTKSETGLE